VQTNKVGTEYPALYSGDERKAKSSGREGRSAKKKKPSVKDPVELAKRKTTAAQGGNKWFSGTRAIKGIERPYKRTLLKKLNTNGFLTKGHTWKKSLKRGRRVSRSIGQPGSVGKRKKQSDN